MAELNWGEVAEERDELHGGGWECCAKLATAALGPCQAR